MLPGWLTFLNKAQILQNHDFDAAIALYVCILVLAEPNPVSAIALFFKGMPWRQRLKSKSLSQQSPSLPLPSEVVNVSKQKATVHLSVNNELWWNSLNSLFKTEGNSGSGHQPGILWGWISMQDIKKWKGETWLKNVIAQTCMHILSGPALWFSTAASNDNDTIS